MDEATRAGHPDTAELQAHADGELQDERVARHVESCATCREEVSAVRRVTAALALGSKSSDSLMARIQAKRAADASSPSPAIRRRSRLRVLAMPVGLAAAAALAIIVPRATREPIRDETSSASGAKGGMPANLVVQQAIVTETGPTSVDSISWDISDGAGALSAELRYLAGVPESARAELLANRVVEQLRGTGMEASSITVIPVPAVASRESPPAGAVAVTIRMPLPRPAP